MAIFSVFPGCGKSYLFRTKSEFPWIIRLDAPDGSIYPDWPVMFDSDSSSFSKDPSFPKNYVDYIEECQKTHPVSVQFVSTLEAVREEMARRGMTFYVISPTADLKQSFLHRYIERDSPPSFVELMDDKFDDFVASCDREDLLSPTSVILKIPSDKLSMLGDIVKTILLFHTAFDKHFSKADSQKSYSPMDLYTLAFSAGPKDTDFSPVSLEDFDPRVTSRTDAYAAVLRKRDQYTLPDVVGDIAWKAGTLFRITTMVPDPTKPNRLDDGFFSVTKDVTRDELQDLISSLNDVPAPQENRVVGFIDKRLLFAARDRGLVTVVTPATVLTDGQTNSVYVSAP